MHRPSDRDVNWMSPVQGKSPPVQGARGKTWKKWSSRILRKIFLFDDFQDAKQGVLVVENLNMFFYDC